MQEDKIFVIKYSEDEDDYGFCRQRVWSDNKEEIIKFSVCDLCECPEDAKVNRDLFNAYDFIEAVKLGFRIAKRGYNEIVIEEIPWVLEDY